MMVEGTVWLSNGEIETLYAVDMLTALKVATESYENNIKRMEFRTLEVRRVGGGKMDQAGNGAAG